MFPPPTAGDGEVRAKDPGPGARQVQVSQGAEYEAPLRVLMQSPVTHIAKSENDFDHPKRVLHPGAVVGPDPGGGPLHAGQDP